MEKTTKNIKIAMEEIKKVYNDLLDILSNCKKDNLSSFELLDLFNRLTLCVAKRDYKNDFLFSEMENYVEQVKSFLQVWDLTDPDNRGNHAFVDNDSVYELTLSDAGTITLETFLVNSKNEYVNLINDEKMLTIVHDFNNKALDCVNLINAKLDKIEADDYIDFESDDMEYKMANLAVFRALKSQNINECTLLPGDVRVKVIEILQKGLHVYDTRDIGNLYALACKELSKTAQIAKIIESQHKSNVLKREKK